VETLVEAFLKRDRAITGAALVGLSVLSWVYILAGAGTGMTALHMSAFPTSRHVTGPMAFMEPMAWTANYAALMLLMWWLMMVAMMLPSAAPTILLYAALTRQQKLAGRPYAPTGLFASGYMAVWGAFGIAAVALQWIFEKTALVSPLMVSTSAILGGLLLIGAGVWQFTPLKQSCLRHCRSPIEVLTRWRRHGRFGSLLTGAVHGAYCFGCCWVMMLLLFYGGIMNVYWIAGLAVLVLVEKVAPAGPRVGGVAGAAFILWGTGVLFQFIS
jgi:predicted metal-binding membrane protein